MVREITYKKDGVKSVMDLNGASVCTQQGTTTELNMADFFRANKMKIRPVVYLIGVLPWSKSHVLPPDVNANTIILFFGVVGFSLWHKAGGLRP